MACEYNLIISEAFDEWTQFLNIRDMIDVIFFLREVLFAKHRKIKDDVILNHIKNIFLKPQPVTFTYQLQTFRRIYLDRLALSSKQVFKHTNLFEIFVSLKTRLH